MLCLSITRSSDLSIIRQIYQQIRERILNGELRSGEKLPSTRELSSQLSVSRNVILEAYDQLLSEGYIVSRRGSGTFVAEGIYLKKDPLPSASIIRRTEEASQDHLIIDFRSGLPSLDQFPRKTWARLAYHTWSEASSTLLEYDHPEGRIELRELLSHYLLKTRRVVCRPEQIIITSGAVQALSLVAQLLITTGDKVIIEDPITQDIQTMFKAAGADLYPVPVDHHGMNTSFLPASLDPAFIFFTPSHQFPLGGVLPIQRQVQLIHYARKKGCFLVEDDYDSEFRYDGSPVSSLQGLEPERVIYIGSFSKILSPALRLGYIILPSALVDRARMIKRYSDLHSSSMDQLILARFINEGYLNRHILKMKKIYKRRRDYLISRLKAAFKEKVRLYGYSTGLHLIAEFPDLVFDSHNLAIIQQMGIKVYPVEEHAIQKGMHAHRLIIGYGHLTLEEIKEGVKRLESAWKNIQAER